MTPAFPLSAVVGQAALVEALLACAVDPLVGGVLVRGERGTAKSTAVRALAPLLPPVDVVPGDPYSLGVDDPDAPVGARTARPVRLVELPVGATAD
ncbi:MAG: magnesium-chelatase subunit, partial [Solirubrobacterales bacterium]|nr:magnesium-chelatase subunit [Solirubrobacterales bacterium]